MSGVSPVSETTPEEVASWFYENSSDGFAVSKEGRLVSANPAWCAIMRRRPEDALGVPIIKVVHADDRSAFLDAVAQLETRGEAILEHRLRPAHGVTVWVRASVKRTAGDTDLIVVQDVTVERRRREEAENQAKVGELLRSAAGVYFWSFDPDTGSYTTEAERRPGSDELGAQHISGAQMGANIHPEDREAFGQMFLPTIRTGEAAHYSYRYINPRGEGWVRYHTAWRGVRQCESGKWEIRGLTQDVTELLDARDAALQGELAAKEAAETKAQFLANMSHEIRTPLNGVLGVLHLLKNEQLSSEARSLLAEAVNCGSMLAELLNDVLDFSKIEAGRLELENQPVDVAAVIDGVAAILRPQVEAKGLSFTTEIEPGVGWVAADPVRLRQVLFNLIGNAVKFTAEGGVSIHLTSSGQGPARRLRFEIKDTGIGIAPDAQAQLFCRFHQADGSTTRRFGGTGLGLAITKKLAELMGGDVGVESVEGEGSTFWIEILAPEIAASAAREVDDDGFLEGLRVLVVEDNPTNRLIATKMLENLGAAVETAENGALGLKAVKRAHFDIVFMDVQMPVMDGVVATKAIRALPEPARSTPIIAMTANAMAHQVRDYLEVGMTGVISKPLSPAAIVAEIMRVAGEDIAPEAAAAA